MRSTALLHDLEAMFFPAHCMFCGAVIPPEMDICDCCTKAITPTELCFSMHFSAEFAAVPCYMPYEYDGKVRKSILEFKFYGHTEYADFYASKIAKQISKKISAQNLDCMTAVPVSAKRFQTRGYNQSELIGRSLSKYLRIPYEELLEKTQENMVQHELPEAQRKENIKGVYAARDELKIEGSSILLIDDIMTTGATMGECCKVLYAAGAKELFCAAIARVS